MDFPLIEDYGTLRPRQKRAGALFDFSLLKCVRPAGARVRRTVETFTGRSMEALTEGQIFYALRVDSHGNALADLTIWRTGHEWFEAMSSGREDVADLLSFTGARHDGADMNGERAVFAGPASLAMLGLA